MLVLTNDLAKLLTPDLCLAIQNNIWFILKAIKMFFISDSQVLIRIELEQFSLTFV